MPHHDKQDDGRECVHEEKRLEERFEDLCRRLERARRFQERILRENTELHRRINALNDRLNEVEQANERLRGVVYGEGY